MFIEGFAVGIGLMVVILLFVLVTSHGFNSSNNTDNFNERMRDRNRDYFNNPVVEYLKRTKKD